MSVLNHLAQAAAVILLIELLVVLLIFLGIAGGLAFGLHWVRGKTDPAFSVTNKYLAKVPQYTERASDIATSPVVKLMGVMHGTQVAAQALRGSVRRRQTASGSSSVRIVPEAATVAVEMRPVAARPIQPPGETTESIETVAIV